MTTKPKGPRESRWSAFFLTAALAVVTTLVTAPSGVCHQWLCEHLEQPLSRLHVG